MRSQGWNALTNLKVKYNMRFYVLWIFLKIKIYTGFRVFLLQTYFSLWWQKKFSDLSVCFYSYFNLTNVSNIWHVLKSFTVCLERLSCFLKFLLYMFLIFFGLTNYTGNILIVVAKLQDQGVKPHQVSQGLDSELTQIHSLCPSISQRMS